MAVRERAVYGLPSARGLVNRRSATAKLAAMPEQQIQAKRERKGELIGIGCFVQGAGLVAPFILGSLFGSGGTLIGVVLLVLLLLVGSRLALKWRCGNCKNPIAGKEVQVCPVCKASLR